MITRLSRIVALVVWGLVAANAALAQPLNYDGTLKFVETDDGTGLFAGTPIGTPFSISIGDLETGGTFTGGLIEGAGKSSGFNCAAPKSVVTLPGGAMEEECANSASGPAWEDDVALSADDAALLNLIFGIGTYAENDLVDIVNIEGDTADTPPRLEAGFSFLFDAATFSAGSLFSDIASSFDPASAAHTLFFVLESVGPALPGDDDVVTYSALGSATARATGPGPNPMPEPPTVLLVGMTWLMLSGCRKHWRRRRSGIHGDE